MADSHCQRPLNRLDCVVLRWHHLPACNRYRVTEAQGALAARYGVEESSPPDHTIPPPVLPRRNAAIAGWSVVAHNDPMTHIGSNDLPDGIDERHVAPVRGLRAHASPLAFIVLGGMLAIASTGLLGGMPAPVTTVHAPAASLELKIARPLRSGLFFETRILVTARRAINKPVIGVDASLWRDLTINSQVPAPVEESFKRGQYRFGYGALKAGETLEIKIDGQTNPPLIGGVAGKVTLLDDEASLVETHIAIPVLP